MNDIIFNATADAMLRIRLPAIPTIVREHDIAPKAVELLRAVLPEARCLLLVMDAHTRAALGERLEGALASAFSTHVHILGRGVLPDEAAAETLHSKAQACGADALIAVGSGTINDLCKHVSAQMGQPYAVFPTAPSMNGYTSANASIIVNGLKQSFAAQLPRAVLIDIEVLANAPARLIRAGLGDALARPTAQADWLLSHLLLGTPYDAALFELTAPLEQRLFAHTDALMRGDVEIMTLLIDTLLLSGFAMTMAGGSYPASQGEHMIAHCYELLEARAGDAAHAFHGEQIGVTTLTMAWRQEQLLAAKSVRLCTDMLSPVRDKGFEIKRQRIAMAKALDEKLNDCWKEMAARIEAVTLPSALIRQALTKANAPATPGAIGWGAGRYEEAVANARYTRDRFTFLDVEAG